MTDRDGKNLPVPTTACNRVLDRQVADSVTSVLSQVIDGPLPGRTGRAMSLGRDAGGKTGTINDSAAVWFVGFTPDLAAAVATYDPRGGYGHPMQNITIGGRYYKQVFGLSLPGPIWRMAMLDALAGTPKTPFDLQTLDGLGTTPTPPPSPSSAPSASGSPGPSASGSPGPGGTPAPSTSPQPLPSTTPTPKPKPSKK